MPQHDVEHFAEIWRVGRFAAIEDVCEVTEEPGSAKAAAADDDTVAARLPHHSKSILGFPYITIAQHWNLQCLFKLGDRVPIGVTVIELRRRASVQANGCASFLLSDTAGGEKCKIIRIDSHSEFDGHWNLLCVAHGGPDDTPQEIRLHRNGGATTFSRHFWHGTSKIHIQVIDAALVDKTF